MNSQSPVPQSMVPQTPPGLPHDVRGLVPYETPWYVYAGWVLLGVVLCLLILWAYRKLQDYQSRQKAAPVPVDPWERVKTRLNSLSPRNPFERGAQVEYFFQLSMLLREAIELRTKIAATDRTYQELKKPLESKLPLRTDEVGNVLAFLERADMVKFAEQPASLEEALESRTQITRWVQMLTPRQDVIQSEHKAEPTAEEGHAHGVR